MRTSRVALGMLAACLAGPGAAQTPAAVATVPARAQTAAVASGDDAADDPAIWINRARPSRSLIIATDKKAGLGVYGLDGALRSTLAAGRVNNVDLRDRVMIGGKRSVLVGASDRNVIGAGKLALFTLDPDTAALTRLSEIDVGVAEAYGACLYRARGGALYGFIVGKDGSIVQIALDLGGRSVSGTIVRRLKLATQAEGCVADDRTGQLYVGEEAVGVWAFGADPADSGAGRLVAPVRAGELVADTEGVAIAAEGRRGGYLVVSSQGDSTYALYRLPDVRYVGRFRIVASLAGIGGTSETDGIEVTTVSLGRDWRGGMMIAQDGDNAPNMQNFKMVRWSVVLAALGLPRR